MRGQHLLFVFLIGCGSAMGDAKCSWTEDDTIHDKGAPTSGSSPVIPGVTIENRTGGPIRLRTRNALDLRIDRRAIDGRFALPVPDRAFAHGEWRTLEDRESTALEGGVTILDGDGATEALGGTVEIGDAPRLLAVGTDAAKLVARLGVDGRPSLEAEDAKVLSLVTADREIDECSAETIDAPFDGPGEIVSSAYPDFGPDGVRSVTRDANGCREFEIGDERPEPFMRLRACVPDEAYPFADGDEILVHGSGHADATATIELENGRGDRLVLGREVFLKREPGRLEGITLTFDEDVTCARVDPGCGHVEVPVQLTARTSDGVVHRVVYGQPIDVPSEGRKHFVLAASARPIAATRCGPEQPLIAEAILARAWVASVYRAP